VVARGGKWAIMDLMWRKVGISGERKGINVYW